MVTVGSVSGASQGGSIGSSKSMATRRDRAGKEDDENGDNILNRGSSLEYGIFGVLFTLSKEKGEDRIRIRWALLKILLDAWQLFTTVITPAAQGWSIDPNGTAWAVVGVLNFTWLADLGYNAYLAVLYGMVVLLAVNVMMCVWVAWCFKEHKFPVVWPIKVLRVFSSVFFQAFDVASLNLLQLGISCRYTGPVGPHLHFALFPQYGCMASPHIMHAVVSALSLVLFVTIALFLNMAEVEVNPLSRRPIALGHSGAEVTAFAIKVLLTLVNVFFGWQRVAACIYLALSLALAWQYLRWSPHLVAWANYLKSGVAITIVWCSTALMLLVFEPGVKSGEKDKWADLMTIVMLGGLAPAFGIGALMSWHIIRSMTSKALKAMANKSVNTPLMDALSNIDEPRDIEVVARCCRVWKDPSTLEPEAVNKAHQIIKAGLVMFPSSAYMVLLHANFMINVLGVNQSGSRRIEDARKLNPSLICRFIMFIRAQEATQSAAGNSVNNSGTMDLLGYVEYQRKQRMVVRLHREALQAMCSFWKALDASTISFTYLSKALGRIESSVSQAQAAYRVVLENYGNNPKLVHLYARFLQNVKNDPWRAAEYFAEAERLEEMKDGNSGGPLMPDGTPLSRMDEVDTAVLVLTAGGEVQMANRHTQMLFGYKRGTLEGKPMATLLAPHFSRRLAERLAAMASTHEEAVGGFDESVVGLHYDRLAFPAMLSLRKASGVGEDSTIIALVEPMPAVKGVASLWVTHNGIVTACDPPFVANFGWKATEVNGASIKTLISVQAVDGAGVGGDEELRTRVIHTSESASEIIKRLLLQTAGLGPDGEPRQLPCLLAHKYDTTPMPCTITAFTENGSADAPPVHELRITLVSEPVQILAVNRKGVIVHASAELAACLQDGAAGAGAAGQQFGGLNIRHHRLGGGGGPDFTAVGSSLPAMDTLGSRYTLFDFLMPTWKDVHIKMLKDTTSVNPLAMGQWSCRKGAVTGPILELRSVSGKEVFMHVSVATADVAGDVIHVVHMARSSRANAVAERRVRLRLSADGTVAAIDEGNLVQLFGLEPSEIVGRGLWEIVDESVSGATIPTLSSSHGPRMMSMLNNRALTLPKHSWRVRVIRPPSKRRSSIVSPSSAVNLSEAACAALVMKHAVMQVYVEVPAAGGNREADAGPPATALVVDLWPSTSVTGVLGLDALGRVRAVLEEHTRPAGLLFGVPNESLVGSMLGELVALPHDRSSPGDLLSLHGTKKSSLKTGRNKESNVKMGPVHVLQASHLDGLPVTVDVQIVGRPGPNEPMTAVLRYHVEPMLPRAPAATLRGPASTAIAPTTPTNMAKFNEAAATGVGERSVGATTAAVVNLSPNRLSLRVPPKGSSGALIGTAGVAASIDGSWLDEKSVSKPGFSTCTLQPVMADNAVQRSGYSDVDLNDSSGAVVAAAPLRPEMLDEVCEGLPLPGVMTTTSNGAQQAGRSKLADMVKSMGDGARASVRIKASSKGLQLQDGSSMEKGAQQQDDLTLPGAITNAQDNALGKVRSQHSVSAAKQAGPVGIPVLMDDDDDDAGSIKSSGHNTGDRGLEAKGRSDAAAGRVLEWVSSKGAFYQNSTTKADDDDKSQQNSCDGDVTSDDDARPPGAIGTSPLPGQQHHLKSEGTDGKRRMGPGLNSEDAAALPAEDDAASDGGQSAMSGAQSASGTEYTRGKRFRKLAKLMDSSQAQQVQRRLRIHALATVALLAILHIICFVLTITAINSQRASMEQLSRSGQAQFYLHRILTDLRSLDIISANKSLPNLYTPDDTPMLVNRISSDADEIKARLNEILNGAGSSGTAILSLLFYNQQLVWDGNEVDGSDRLTHLTIWDFATRFYTMAKNVEQNMQQWSEEGIRIQDTSSGQFLLKSGPDLFDDTREVLDALLFAAVSTSQQVEILQIVFLVVEGAATSFLAACYLMYLLRSVASQRYKLYGTFLVIPLGLTRALASQNTNLLVEDDEDEDEDEDRMAQAPVQEKDDAEADSAAAASKLKRRATLKLQDDFGAPAKGVTADGPWGSRRAPGVPDFGILGGTFDKFDKQQAESMDRVGRSRNGCWTWMTRRLRAFGRRTRRSVVLPLQPSLTSGAGLPSPGTSKRILKYDSNETFIMMVPFVIWSIMVISIYAVAVVKIKGVDEAVAVHSVVNSMSARAYRTVFYSQELADVDGPEQLTDRRAKLLVAMRLTRDAWYTLQLGATAYLAAGNDTERFPLVRSGLAHSSPDLTNLFYSSGSCHRVGANLPCAGPSYRFYQICHTGIDSMMQQFIISTTSMSTNQSMIPEGLEDEHFDFVYNVGSKDLLDGTIEIAQAHYVTILALFTGIRVLHIILFLSFWIIFTGFLLFLLNPLLKRVAKERRRIAELMSQLPLELDVEKLIDRALGAAATSQAGQGSGPGGPDGGTDRSMRGGVEFNGGGGHSVNAGTEATNKWKAIIRASSQMNGRLPDGSRNDHK